MEIQGVDGRPCFDAILFRFPASGSHLAPNRNPVGAGTNGQFEKIPAIPTAWAGYRFRSRVEARWAIALTELKIEFSYEMEGIALPGGDWYLPDFFLPRVNMWAEVKGCDFTPGELSKCKQLMRCTDRNCLYLVGAPDFTTYKGTSWDCDEFSETDYLLDVDWHGRKHYNRGRLFASTGGSWNCPGMFTEAYRGAVYLARSERFQGAA